MQLSTRNQLRGTVQSVRASDLLTEEAVDVGGQTITSVITATLPSVCSSARDST